jgi:hypothetical protein
MRRRLLVLALAACIVAIHTGPAEAQTIIVSPGELIGGKDDDDKKPPKKEDTEANCPSTLPLICAGELVIDGASAGAQAVGGAVMGGLAAWVGQGAAWLVGQIGHQIDRSTRPAVDSAWFKDRYAGIRGLAIALSALFLLLAVLQAVFRQDLAGLLRAVLIALPATEHRQTNGPPVRAGYQPAAGRPLDRREINDPPLTLADVRPFSGGLDKCSSR